MPKIPNIKKFRGDNDQSFTEWISQFEAQCSALDVSAADDKKKWRDMLMVTTESDAFSTVTSEISADNAITYADLKAKLIVRYTGENYKRYLEIKLRNLKFRQGTNINEFLHELRSTIREFYGIADKTAIDKIGMSHIISQVDESYRGDIQILQLAGNKSGISRIENLLELLASKMKTPFSQHASSSFYNPTNQNSPANFNQAMAMAAENINNDRLSRLEKSIEGIVRKLDHMDIPTESSPATVITCSFCNKKGHHASKCFKQMECFKCKTKGHIAKYCRKDIQNSAGSYENVNSELPLSCRMMLKVIVGEIETEFLYDPGSQYTMLPRKIYDRLKYRPPLLPITSAGIGVDGHKFSIDGVVNLNYPPP